MNIESCQAEGFRLGDNLLLKKRQPTAFLKIIDAYVAHRICFTRQEIFEGFPVATMTWLPLHNTCVTNDHG